VSKITPAEFLQIHKWIKVTLAKGIDFGGDSMSDYRNPMGEKGSFQHEHNAYRKTGKPCARRGCKGTIKRKVVGQRSAHFCDVHQK
jgi:formamidopyrimidine-DNA glycosylase